MAFNVIVWNFMVELVTGKEKLENKLGTFTWLLYVDQRGQTTLLIPGGNDAIYLIELLYAESMSFFFATQRYFNHLKMVHVAMNIWFREVRIDFHSLEIRFA